MPFSDRMGLRPRPPIQLESIDQALRNSLFNVAGPYLTKGLESIYSDTRAGGKRRFDSFWTEFLRKPIHLAPSRFSGTKHSEAALFDFFNSTEWHRVYDAVEFLVDVSGGKLSQPFNTVLEREVSGYRVLNGVVTPISDSAQIAAIQSGLDASKGVNLEGVNSHLNTSLKLLSDRTKPDYRNSIKESISAIESLASVVTEQPKPNLKDALKQLEQSGTLHPALRGAFQKLYGWTSDEDGIRHALMEESNLDFADAQFMLVASSAFVHFMVAKLAS